MAKFLLVLSFLSVGLAAAQRPYGRDSVPDGPPAEVYNNFGPNWGDDQPWREDDTGSAPDYGASDYDGDLKELGEAVAEDEAAQATATPPPVPTTAAPAAPRPQTFHLPPLDCRVPCPFTHQFNPVCGSDGNTYRNPALLKCFVRCGQNVNQRRLGAC